MSLPIKLHSCYSVPLLAEKTLNLVQESKQEALADSSSTESCKGSALRVGLDYPPVRGTYLLPQPSGHQLSLGKYFLSIFLTVIIPLLVLLIRSLFIYFFLLFMFCMVMKS